MYITDKRHIFVRSKIRKFLLLTTVASALVALYAMIGLLSIFFGAKKTDIVVCLALLALSLWYIFNEWRQWYSIYIAGNTVQLRRWGRSYAFHIADIEAFYILSRKDWRFRWRRLTDIAYIYLKDGRMFKIPEYCYRNYRQMMYPLLEGFPHLKIGQKLPHRLLYRPLFSGIWVAVWAYLLMQHINPFSSPDAVWYIRIIAVLIFPVACSISSERGLRHRNQYFHDDK